MLVRVAELDPKTLVLGVADRCNAPPGLGARNIAAGPGNIEVRPIKLADLTTHLAVAPGRLAIAPTDRPPRPGVGRESPRPAEAMQYRRELPAPGASLPHPGIAAGAAGRPPVVRRLP